MTITKAEMEEAGKAGMDASLGFTDGMSAAERRAALGVGSSSGSTSSSSVKKTGGSSQDPGTGSKFDSDAFLKRLTEQLGPAGVAIPDSIKGAIVAIGEKIESQNKSVNTIVEKQLGYLFEARKTLGNISVDMATGQLQIAGDAKHYVETFENILVDATDSMQASSELQFAEGYGQNLDPLYNFFVSAEAAANKFGKIMKEVGSDTPKIIQEINDIEAKKITFFSETLQIAERDVSTLLERQYAFTGEASDKILGDIGTTAKSLSDTTGIAANQLKAGIVDVMRDVDKFGDIGVDSAGRISAALLQLGVDFNSFQSLTDSFMNFDTAANKMGELSTLFGVQMDAMEMTYLANEDQEEFLFRMREEILDAGIDVENMSKTRARALASQLNMSVTEMKTFLRDDELTFGQGALEESTTAAEGMDALTVAGRDFGNEFARSAQSASDALDEKFIPGIVSSRDALAELATQSNQTYSAIQQFRLPEGFNIATKEMTDARVALEKVKTVAADKGVDLINEMTDAGANLIYDFYAKNIEDFKDNIESEIDGLYEKYSPDNIDKDALIAQLEIEISQIDTSNIQAVVDKAEIERAKTEAQVKDLIDAYSATKDQADQALAKLSNEEPIIFRVDLDGDTIADTTYKVLLKNGQIITADTRA